MPGFGTAFGRGARRRPRSAVLDPVFTTAPATLSPAAGWTGAAGSGFAAAPVDSARTTAKPAVRMLQPPNLFFTDELLVGVIAAANNGGTLIDYLGIAKVRVHYEGSSLDIAKPSFQTFADANGVERTYFGWWAKLKRDGRDGDANVYFEAFATDPTMQTRLIGPYTYYPAAKVHDIVLEVAPSQPVIAGQRYQSFYAAGEHARTTGKQNPLIVFTEGGTQFMTRLASGYATKGRLTVTATQPTTILPSYDASYSYFRMVVALHLKGGNITLDLSDYGGIYCEPGYSQNNVFDGCKIKLGTGTTLSKKQAQGGSQTFSGNPWFLEFDVEWTTNVMINANLVRGGTATDCNGDLFTGALCVVGHTAIRHDDTVMRAGVPSVGITYTGAATTATVESSGTATKTFTFKAGGTTVGTFVCNTAATSTTNYTNQQFADYVNGLGGGWSATLLDNAVYANALSLQTGTPGVAFAAQTVKNTVLTLNGRFDFHGDWRQGGGTNVICMDNVSYLAAHQSLFVDGAFTDAVFINNCWGQRAESTVLMSQTSLAWSHVVIAHNSWSVQRASLNHTCSSTYCLWANNAHVQLFTAGNVTIANANFVNNHIQAGSAPTGATGTTIGGSDASIYAGALSGDFAPRGELLANLKLPVVQYDRKRTKRSAVAAAGAVAA